MQWILARLREDSTRSAIGQLGLLIALVAVLMGADLAALLTQAEAYAARIVALAGTVAAIAVQMQRIITPEPRATVAEVVPGELLPLQTDPGLACAVAEEVERRLRARLDDLAHGKPGARHLGGLVDRQ